MMSMSMFITMLSACSLAVNPMKMCITMVGASALLMAHLYFITGKSWLCLNVLLLFMGGILLMFMILSSTLPNEKMKSGKNKMNMSIGTTILLTSLAVLSFQSFNSSQQMPQVKFFMTNGSNLPLLLSVVILYFSLFMYLIKQNKTSMRSLM